MALEDRIIAALDVPDLASAERAINTLKEHISFFKIGYQLAPIGGFQLAQNLSEQGKRVFLDLKYHDIGNTVEKGVASIRKIGADFLTVHAEPDVLAGAMQGRADDPRLKILAVTVLTSLNTDSLSKIGISIPIQDLVLKRAEMAAEAGADGVVASAQEARAIRARFGDDLTIVTPGIRPPGGNANDQKRVVTPNAALEAGADFLVIGRPIIAADDPAQAVTNILRNMAGEG